MQLFRAAADRYERWLTAPAPNAAGQIGLARIVFCFYFLWILSRMHMAEIAARAVVRWEPPDLFTSWRIPPSSIVVLAAEMLLIAALVLLLFGWRVRIMTLTVLVVGVLLGAARNATFVYENTSALTFFYVPLVMLFSDWGCIYSLDALRKSRCGEFVPDVSDTAWRYVWPARVLLIILAFLLFTGGYRKLTGGAWLVYPDWLSSFLVSKGVVSYLLNDTPMNPGTQLLVSIPGLLTLAQYGVVLFELAAPLVLFSPVFRALHLRMLPLFHAFNAYFLGIPFIFALGFYPFFVDWQRLRPDRLRLPFLARIPTSVLTAGAIGTALLTALLWNMSPIPRAIFSLGGLFNNNYGIWGAILLGWLVWQIVELRAWFIKDRIEPQRARRTQR